MKRCTYQPSAICPVAIKIDVATEERVKRLAAPRNRTPNWLMREAISHCVEREEQREAFRQDGIESWRSTPTCWPRA